MPVGRKSKTRKGSVVPTAANESMTSTGVKATGTGESLKPLETESLANADDKRYGYHPRLQCMFHGPNGSAKLANGAKSVNEDKENQFNLSEPMSPSGNRKRNLPSSLETTPTKEQTTKVRDLVLPSSKKRVRREPGTVTVGEVKSVLFKPIIVDQEKLRCGSPVRKEREEIHSPLLSPMKRLADSLPTMEPLLDEYTSGAVKDVASTKLLVPGSEDKFTAAIKEGLSTVSCSPDESPLLSPFLEPGTKSNKKDDSLKSLFDFGEWSSLTNHATLKYTKPVPVKPPAPCNAGALPFLSPKFNFQNKLETDEVMKSPAFCLMSALPNTSLVALEPIKSSPFPNAFSQNVLQQSKSSAFFPFESVVPLESTSPTEVAQDQSPHDSENENEFESLADFFDVKEGKDDDGKSIKWLEFKITPFKPGGNNDLQGNASFRVVTPRSPWPANLPKLNDELSEEMQMKGELWAAWREVESTYLPNASYFAYQNLAKHQRTILVNWAMEVAADLELSRQTFEVAMNIFDRFFSATKFVDKDLFQVLMTACLWIGAKKEEIEPPKLGQIFEIASTPNLTLPQLYAIEIGIVNQLNWRLNPPTFYDWLTLYLRKATLFYPDLFPPPVSWSFHTEQYPPEMFSFRKDIFCDAMSTIEIFMHMSESLEFTPSVVAAAAFYQSCYGRLRASHDDVLECIEISTGYAFGDLKKCVDVLQDLVGMRRELFPVGDPSQPLDRQPFYPELCDLLTLSAQEADALPLLEDEDFGLSNFDSAPSLLT